MIDTNYINEYLDNFLIPRLNTYLLSEETITIVAKDIENRLSSVIYHWNDSDFRQTLFVIGREEACFYKPKADLDVSCLVVLAVRNSLIEDLGSTDEVALSKYGLTESPIDDMEMRHITEEAITYFSQIDLVELAKNNSLGEEDTFGSLPVNYPVVWEALHRLSKCIGVIEEEYTPLVEKPYAFDFGGAKKSASRYHEQVLSGISSDIDDSLLGILKSMENEEVDLFFSDSFKMITRNPIKLLKIFEFVLRKNKAVVTANYYISNGYVSRRRKLFKPAHNSSEVKEKINKTKDLTKIHRTSLGVISKQF